MSDQNTPPVWAGTGGAVPEDAPEYLNRWVIFQHWFTGAGGPPRLTIVAQWELATPGPDVRIRCLLVRDRASTDRALYQIPLTERAESVPALSNALIAIVRGPQDTPRFVYDAPYDQAYTDALVRFMLRQESVPPFVDITAATVVQGKTIADSGTGVASVSASRVYAGAQSHTSIVVDLVDDNLEPVRPLICKVFRAVHHGDNPEIVTQSALARAGSRFTPEPVACVTAEWPDSSQPDGRASGHLAFLQQFFPDVSDAWHTALRAAAAGEDFTEHARSLGEATARVHADLAATMPTLPATTRIKVAVATGMLNRFREASTEVSDLADLRTGVESIYARALQGPWPRQQHIHGDLHLEQVLDVPDRGWIFLDFEGDPLRTPTDRGLPDCPIRDVADMLRSIAYVPGTVARKHPHHDPARLSAWTTDARRAFLRGYSDTSGLSLRENDVVLAAFELDKAICQAVYDIRKRPGWPPLPLFDILRLVTSFASSRNDHH